MAWYDNIDRANTRLTPTANPNNYGSMYGIGANQNFGIPGIGVGNQFANARRRMTSDDAYRGTFPGSAYSPHRGFEEMQFDETVETPDERTNWITKGGNFLKKFSPTGIINALTRRQGATESFGGYPGGWGSRAGLFPQEVSNLQAVANAGYLGNQGQDVFGTNVVSQFGDYNKAMAKNLGVFQETMKDKGFSNLDELEDYYSKFGDKSYILNKLRHVRGMTGQPTEIIQDKTTTDIIPAGTTGSATTPGASERARQGGYNPSSRSFRSAPGGLSQAQSRAARGDPTGTGGGWKWAQGGRVGYQDGELVEDEYMAEATPGGMMEENIEEVQGEPTREQLEAIALEIFRLPLEELNEEQLNVVYQAAMEQEPAEEEVQFAAQEGPGEGIASLV